MFTNAWDECQTCKQKFTGAMQLGLAEAWWAQVCRNREGDGERRAAAHNMANALMHQGRLAEAEKMFRERLRRLRGFGPDHPQTVMVKSNLAGSLAKQGRSGRRRG